MTVSQGSLIRRSLHPFRRPCVYLAFAGIIPAFLAELYG